MAFMFFVIVLLSMLFIGYLIFFRHDKGKFSRGK
jgi:hypothetical protein